MELTAPYKWNKKKAVHPPLHATHACACMALITDAGQVAALDGTMGGTTSPSGVGRK
jgi:hypothetical protein